MDPEERERLKQLLDRIVDVKDQVSDLEEQVNRSIHDVDACHQAIDDIMAEYRAILDAIPETDRDRVERRYGRKVMDMRRHAAWLPDRTCGVAVPLATEDQWTVPGNNVSASSGVSPSALIHGTPSRRPRASSGPRVGGEIEAWCGPCKGLRGHTIVAMVGDQPKQVLCQSCGAKHGFRLTPARGVGHASPKRKTKGKLTKEEVARQRMEAAQTALQTELVEAKNVRPFNKRERYRVGEIVEHPDFGRGKVEHVVRGSILIRFRNGPRPISTV